MEEGNERCMLVRLPKEKLEKSIFITSPAVLTTLGKPLMRLGIRRQYISIDSELLYQVTVKSKKGNEQITFEIR